LWNVKNVTKSAPLDERATVAILDTLHLKVIRFKQPEALRGNASQHSVCLGQGSIAFRMKSRNIMTPRAHSSALIKVALVINSLGLSFH
jgi:hypothetical protein